jgi:hypothetical protein
MHTCVLLQLQKKEKEMENNYVISSIFYIAKADFLQRIRSYYFLIALGVCVFIIYSFVPPVDAGYTMVSLGNYRGFYNSAWVGSMVAMCVPFFALIGFYVVNNAVKRDIDTGVGQIIATTQITKVQYLTGKLISNFAVLLLILVVIAVMTVIMFLFRGETSHLEPGKLLLPLLILTVPAMFIIAALALFFDSFTSFSRGFLNIAYFFLWIFLVSGSLWSPATDVYGVNTCMIDIKNSISGMHSDWNGNYGTGILIKDSLGSCQVFTWEGMNWTPWIFLQRIFWMTVVFGLVMLSSLRFNRFDTSETKERKQRVPWFIKKKAVRIDDDLIPAGIKYHDLPVAEARFSYFSLLKAELRLMLRGTTTLLLILTAGLFIASIFIPMDFAYKVALPLLWFLQILNLSKQGSREVTHRCNEYVFSAVFPLKRQLPATLSSALLALLMLSIPVLLRVLLSGNFYGVYAIIVGAMFVSAFAIASGILTGGSKIFEVIFTVMVYGILNRIPFFDFIGAIEGSKDLFIAHHLLGITALLVILAFSGRKRQIKHAHL